MDTPREDEPVELTHRKFMVHSVIVSNASRVKSSTTSITCREPNLHIVASVSSERAAIEA